MPTYDYLCNACGKRFKRVESISKHERARVSCPKCKSTKVRRELAPFYAKTAKKS